MRQRHELSEPVWARRKPLLPPWKASKSRKDNRLVVTAILWKLADGTPRRDLPERYGSWQTGPRASAAGPAGVWDRIFAAVQQQADAAGEQDGERHVVPGTGSRARQHATTMFEHLLDQRAVKRPGRGRPKWYLARIAGDQGPSSRRIRRTYRRRGCRVTIARKVNERRTGPFGRATYRLRRRVERRINRGK